jgi:uncharacterized protein (TIGR02996 family)
MSTEAALLAAVGADPDDDTARLVYADFLQERAAGTDTARAEFIRAQVELARPPQRGQAARRRTLLARAKALQKRHGAEWAAPVFDAVGTRREGFAREIDYDRWDRGFLDWLSFESLAAFRDRAPAVLALGPITGLSLQKFNDADARALADLPALRTVRRLSLFGSGRRTGPFERNIGDDTAAALAASPHLARLDTLDLAQNRLTTAGVRALAHSPTLSRLTKLRLYGNDLGDDTYAMLVDSPLAGRMTEWRVDGSARITSEAARTLARATHLGHVTAISFDNTDIADDGVEALAGAHHLAGLRDLDFRCTPITDRAVRVIARAPVFANLERLNFVKTWIGGTGARYLRESKTLTRIKFLALYEATPGGWDAALKKRFGRKVIFYRI